MEADLRRNPGLLKLDLYCRGIRLDDTCVVERKGGRKILRTRAGLGSGLELILPGDPDNSFALALFSQRKPAGLFGPEQMPPLATEVVDDEGVDTLRAWIEQISPE